MARPTDLKPEISAEICEHLAEGATLKDAAALAGIREATVRNWVTKGRSGMRPYAAFVEQIERARARFRKGLIDQVQIYAGADQPHSWRAALALYQELEGSSRGAERAKAREEITDEILGRLRTQLDSATFARVVEALCDEGSEPLPSTSSRGVH